MHHDRSFPGFRQGSLGEEVAVKAFIQIEKKINKIMKGKDS